ncbi:MAG: hypothetical protein JXR91_08675 [Deltaproteobacteria bacterium]|nr:hypothetical protein [Deltaproteobacteria bacterium]
MVRKKNNKSLYLKLFLASVVIISLFHFVVLAQDAPPAVNVTVNQDNTVPAEQRGQWVNEHTEHAKNIYRKVQNMLEQARQEKDSIKITCLDDKLTQINVNLRGIEVRKEAFETALSSTDNASADQHFTVLTIYSSKIDGLEAEAEGCIGESDVVLGETNTSVTISEDITEENPASENNDNVNVSTSVDVYQNAGTELLPKASGYL